MVFVEKKKKNNNNNGAVSLEINGGKNKKNWGKEMKEEEL
jgi:hypothetical protein